MESKREQNQEIEEQIATLKSLLKCHWITKRVKEEGKEEEEFDMPLFELGWEYEDAEKIQKKILELIDELK